VSNKLSKPKLRSFIAKTNDDLSVSIEYLWNISRDLHNHQNEADGTENGRRHVENVEENIGLLIDSNEGIKIDDFEVQEVFVMSATACCHDFDKALKKFDQDTWPFKHKRLLHGIGSADFVMKNYESLGLAGKKSLAQCVSKVCAIHSLKGLEFEKAVGKLPAKTATAAGPINVHKVALILKAADILHTTESRVITLVEPGSLQGVNKNKYLARKCISGWRISGERIVIQSIYESIEQHRALKDCKEYMLKKEWPCVGKLLQPYGFPYELTFEINKAEGVVAMPDKEFIRVDRDRNFDISVTNAVLNETANLPRNSICRNEYVSHATGSVASLMAIKIMFDRVSYVRNALENFGDDLKEEEDYSFDKLQEHITFLSHLSSILSQLVNEPASNPADKALGREERGNMLAKIFRELPGGADVVDKDLPNLLRRLKREIKILNDLLKKVVNRLIKLTPKQRELARKDKNKYQTIIKPVMMAFFSKLRTMKKTTNVLAGKIVSFKDGLMEDWNNDIYDILLVDENCRLD